ncbi:subtilisin family serine protease [Kribbella sp. VKM Ac-2527]|uniref:Subtilisin family serine protease n=1 Tax=Kribbella caucasensis TaxID=2512215 RepID=A0A4R6JK23_9ACTN|nr:S8 family serine peptidase [Kribbella sp. VKM Ac-2527]TDO36429.1 subtilisin family serine protease [Kribbella sp. VKM Ac-2527]
MVSRISSRRGFGAIAVASFVVLGVAGAQPAQAGEAGQGAWSGRAAQPGQPDRSITLITGDRVTLRGGSLDRPAIEPGPGRRHIAFSTQRVKDQLFVVPSDVSSVVTAGRMDRRLFEVTGLIKAGYDDRKTSVIPLLVTYSGRAASRTAPAGATVTRQLPVINGAAVDVTKKNAATFVRNLSTARSANGLDKIWLDGKRHVNLDQSVPQIGAPAAWQAGYTGKGISVAVLDTGIDATHPDLATQVAGAKNFTEEAAGDLVGHGTHVASTIAGTAAASAGKYKGVAPDAKLYDGKICEQGGCPESAILAGMEWAATEVKAKIVNMSIGGPDTPEVDPIEAAVNRLTAQTGTLFVIAAGNSGPGSGSVESPGSADAALTVGAVDKQNQLAEFSSRGPRTGDGALKPDVTAPGVDIVAAKAKDSIIGDPVGDQYLKLSGTSMATPHTVGAAALLAQQHPGWKAGELKGALMASAKPADGQNAFEQGAGRIDVGQAIKQSIVTEPGGVSFGTAQWPHNDDTPVTKTLSYRNLGDQPVTLTLAATFAGPDGSPAPAGALKLSANTVTVPAGGTATVQLTSDTKHEGPDGSYTGQVTATAAGTTVVTPLGADKEVESYTLTVNHVGTDGKPIADGATLVFGIDAFRFQFLADPSGTAKVRLPKGEYLLQGDQAVVEGEKVDLYTKVHPAVELDADTTVVFDARKTKPVSTTVPRADAKVILVDLGYLRVNESGEIGLGSSLLAFGFEGLHTAQLGSKLPPEQFTGHVASHWGLPGKDGRFVNTPYQYGVVNTFPGEFPTGFSRSVKASDLATVEQSFNATGDRPAERTVAGQAPNSAGGWTPILEYDLPAKARLHLEGGEVKWSSRMAEIVPSTDPENPFPTEVTAVESQPTQYRAGRTYRERWNAAAFVPTPGAASVAGGDLLIGVYTNTDADGHVGFTLTDKASSKLYRDGELIGENTEFGYVELTDVPAGKAAYKFVTTGTRASYSGFSTRTDLTWTFTSKGEDEEEFGVRTVRYLPEVDDRNVAKREPVTVLPVRLAQLPGATLPAMKKISLQVSGDDGKTWQRAAVVPTGGDAYKAIFATPKGAKSVSFKANLVDAAGNTTEQTTISAYRLR